MAYNNRIPDISRIAQTVRDKDFIPITELKEFDAKLDEIIEKFSAVNNDIVSSQASNIGDLIKQIEYNMSDAIEFNPDGSIAGFKDVIDETSGATIPVNGENSYINLTDKLEEYYNEFMKLFGNDENSENWKNELTQYKENAIKAFKNRINGIFGRVAEQNAIESKEDEKDDYITSDPVKIKNNQIMRLNPDKHSFTRQITIMPQDVNKDIIAFEVGELEEKSLVLNMKVQNAKMFYNFNIVIDNGEVHITKEEHIKISDHTVNFKIHRYMSGSGKYMYVFVMNTDDPSTNVTYIIELTGILINGYSFGSSGQSPLDHKYYYAYYQVDNTSKPDYNETYYVKSYDNSQVSLKTNYITYTVVKDSVPQEDETYYTSYTKDDGTIVYKEQKLLTQFEEGVVYYTRSVTTKSEGEAVENQYVMIEYTNLREFDPDKEYFVKREEWKLIKEFAIESDTTSGTVDPTDKDIDNNILFDDRNQVVVDGIKFADTLKYKNVDVECEELLGTTSDAEKALKGKEIVRLDDGVRFYKPYPGIISKVRRGAKKINCKLAISLGSKVADLFEIQPSQAIVSTPIVEESIVDKTKDLIDLDLQLNEDDIYAADILEGKVNFYAFLKRISSDEYIESFGQTIHDEILFVNYFNIKFIGTIGDILDFQICADGNENYETCQHIFYNNKEKKVIFPVLRETADQLNTVINVKKRWKMLVSNQTYLFALSYDKEVWYSIDGGYHFKKHRKATKLGLVDIITDKKNFIGITEEGKTYFTTNGFDSYTQITFDGEEISPNRKDDDKIICLGEDLWYYLEDHKILELNHEDSCWDLLYETPSETKIDKKLGLKNRPLINNEYSDNFNGFIFIENVSQTGTLQICFYNFESKNVDIVYSDDILNDNEINCGIELLKIDNENNLHVLLSQIKEVDENNYQMKIFVYKNGISADSLIYSDNHEYINNDKTFVNDVYICYDELSNSENPNIHIYLKPFGKHSKGLFEWNDGNNVIYQETVDSIEFLPEDGDYGFVVSKNRCHNISDTLTLLSDKSAKIAFGDRRISVSNPITNTVTNITEYPLDPDKISEIYDKSKLFVRTISDVGISEAEDEYNNQSEKEMIAFINPTIEAPIFIISKRELQSQFVVHNSILSIKDIVERGMNDILIADSYDGSLQYDEFSGLYTKNIVDNNDIMQYASTSEGVFAYGSGKGQTYIVDWLNSRIKTFENLEVDGILECGVDKSIYIFPSNSNGVFKYDKVNKVIDRENIFPSLNDVNCEYGFETSDGLFIVGVKSTTNLDGDTIEKSVIYFSPNKFDPETFSVGGPASTEEQRVFKEILVTDVIDFCKPFGDEIIISTYDIDNPNVKYRFDRVSQTFKSVSVIDINHIYSFSYAEMYDGKIFVLNGTGSNPDVKCGFGILNKTIYDPSSIGDDDRFYDIEILTPIDDINKSESPSLFVHGGDLFGIVIETNDEGKSECVVYAYIPQTNSFDKMTSENSPLISAITSVANEEIKDIDENGQNIGYSASVQETADKTVEIINNYDFSLENENYQIDKLYFDKENEGIILGNYTNGNNAFRIESNCMALVTTESGNKSQIAIALPKENYIAVFDKSLRSLKTVSLRYKAIVNTTYHYVDVDTSRFTIKGIFGASDLNNNYLYVLIYGKFPMLNQNGSNVTESQVSDDSYRLFRTTIDELLNTNTTGVLYELSTTAHTITDIENYIKSQNLTLSDSIDYDIRNNYQLIGMKRDLLYKNIDSIAFWNTNSGSLDIISPLLWNNDIESDVNISGKNKEETYKDFIVFGDRNDKLYSFDAKSSVLREITKTGVESYAPIYRRGKTNFIGSSTSLNKIKNIEENPNINGCIDSIEFESIEGIEEGVNSSFATKKGLFASSYNNDDDVSYDKFKIVKSDNNIQKNLLTSNDSYKFQRVIDTRFGLFRWCITDSILSVDSRYNKYSVPSYYRYCYFNPNNKSKTITINPGNRSIIYGIWETLEGLFIGIKDYEYVSPDTIETFKLYYMKLIPNDIKLDFISINDERYFEEVDCNHMEVFDMKNTRYGLMIAAGGIGGNNGTNPTTDSSVSDSQLVEPPLGCIMLWNGETFITVDSDFTFNDIVNGIYYPINIFDTSIGLFALCLKSVYDTEQKTYDKFSEAIYQYEGESFVLYSELGEVKNKYVYLNKIFGSCTNRVFIETDIGPVYRSLSGIYDIKRKRIIKNIDDTNIESISIVRKYYESPDIYKSRNLYKIANHLHSRYDLPLDRFMKVFGSIMYNGLQVPVSALKIISRPGNNTEPFTVSFTIDKDARFTRNIDTIKALLEKKSEEGILSSINIGEITDWDIEKQKYIDHPINISKINIVVISDGITDERELEIEENYDFIMEQITSIKSQINDLIYQRSIISEDNNVIHTNIERSIDAKATSGRNLAVNLGFNINEDGCPLPKDGSEDLIKGFTEFIKAIRECEANDDYSKIYIGDYFIVPDFDGSVERFDVIGINTYNTNGTLVGILVQSHYALGDGTTAWSDVIKLYQRIVNDFETKYDIELRPVKRWLGINTYTETSRLNNVKEAVSLISENNTPSNNKFWTQKMFNLAEEEVGHPMNTNCDENSHSSCVIPLYARAPQYRVKRDHDGNPRHCWTDTFCAVDSSTYEGTVLNQQTTGRCIVYGDRNIIVNDLGVSERAMVAGDTYAMDPYYSPCMYI